MTDRVFSIGKEMKRVVGSDDLIVDIAFASDEPYDRWWGTEVLEISDKAIRMGRMNDGAPILFNHDWADLRGVHVPGSVKADKDGVMRGKARLTSVTQAGRDAIALVESGVLSKASVGYQIYKVIQKSTAKSGEKIERVLDGAVLLRAIQSAVITRDGRAVGGDLQAFRRSLDEGFSPASSFTRANDDDPDEFIVVDWEPLENSLVTVPADNTVGVGRMAQRSLQQPADNTPATTGATMAETTAAAGANADTTTQGNGQGDQQQRGHAGNGGGNSQGNGGNAGSAGNAGSGDRAVEMERNRKRGIENLAKANKIDDGIRDYWIGTGLSVEAITEDLLKIIEERGKNNPQSVAALGLTEKETQRFSLFNAIRAVADKNWTNAGFELECSREISKKLNRMPDPNKFYVPFEIQQRQIPMRSELAREMARAMGRRDLTVASGAGGGYLVETQNVSFIEVLRNRSVAYRLGARRLAGLVGSVTVPKQTAGATAYWLASESTQVTESAQTFAQMALSPKTVGAYTEISRQLLLQSSPDAESIVTMDLGAVTALAVDKGVIAGSGSGGQPTGIITTGGIGTVSGTTFTFASILEFQTDVASANVVPVSGGYVTDPTVAALAMTRVKFANTATPLWDGNIWDGNVCGFPGMSSNQMAAGTMLFGDWAQVVVAEWGVLEVEVNPYANFQAGIIGVRALVSMDVGLRYAGAFSYGGAMT